MEAVKLYIEWSLKRPMHPRDANKKKWESGIDVFGGQINPSNMSLSAWQKEQAFNYEKRLKYYKTHGRIKSFGMLTYPTKQRVLGVEKEETFIEWVKV